MEFLECERVRNRRRWWWTSNRRRWKHNRTLDKHEEIHKKENFLFLYGIFIFKIKHTMLLDSSVSFVYLKTWNISQTWCTNPTSELWKYFCWIKHVPVCEIHQEIWHQLRCFSWRDKKQKQLRRWIADLTNLSTIWDFRLFRRRSIWDLTCDLFLYDSCCLHEELVMIQ